MRTTGRLPKVRTQPRFSAYRIALTDGARMPFPAVGILALPGPFTPLCL